MSICNASVDESLAIVDHSHLELLVGPDLQASRDLLDELISLYEGENEPQLEDFKKALTSGDVEAATKHIHFVAGSSGNMGLARLSSFCRTLEKLLKDEPISGGTDTIVETLEELYKTSVQAFRALL